MHVIQQQGIVMLRIRECGCLWNWRTLDGLLEMDLVWLSAKELVIYLFA